MLIDSREPSAEFHAKHILGARKYLFYSVEIRVLQPCAKTNHFLLYENSRSSRVTNALFQERLQTFMSCLMVLILEWESERRLLKRA